MTSRNPISRWLGLLALCCTFVALAQLRSEDEDPNFKKPLKKVIVPDDGPAGVGLNALTDLVRARNAAKHTTIKEFYSAFVVPFDRVITKTGAVQRVNPLPLVFGKDRYPDPYGVAPIDANNDVGEVVSVPLTITRQVQPFEQIALTAVDQLFKLPNSTPADKLPTMPERYAAAERLLTQVLFFHENALEQRKRTGKNWEPLKLAVDDKLTKVRMEWVQLALKQKDWPLVRELTDRFIQRYKADDKLLKELYSVRLSECEELVTSEKLPDLERVRDSLLDYESRFPNSPTDTVSRIRTKLTARANQFIEEAESKAVSNPNEARNILRNVEALDPDEARLKKLQQQLRSSYAVLVVAARRMPERFTPATARFDSEKQAVELLFEGLLESRADDKLGIVYTPALLNGKPQTSALARTVQIHERAAWSLPEAGIFDAADLLGTLKLNQSKSHLPGANLAEWYAEPSLEPANPSQLKLNFHLGHPDPRHLLSLKMLPARWLESQGKAIDDREFAAKPVGTGPFKLSPSNRTPEAGKPLPDVVFDAQAWYGRRPGRISQPHIKEVRFVHLKNIADPVAELGGDRLHIVTDIPTQELDRYSNQVQAAIVTPSTNRRIHYLAVNHRNAALQQTDLRRGLIHAIDREAILNTVFRAGKKEYHKALNGPFPANSWLVAKSASAPNALYQRDVAAAKLERVSNSSIVTILYPNDEPLAKDACELIKKQLEAVSSAGKLSIALEAVPPTDLHRRVFTEHRYELAYLSHEYASDWSAHELASWLDPKATGTDGRNCFGYLAKETTPEADDDSFRKLLGDVRSSRDPERIQTMALEIHKRFHERVPFIPLWQIDSHMAISTRLKLMVEGSSDPLLPRLLNPTTLFSGIARWRIE